MFPVARLNVMSVGMPFSRINAVAESIVLARPSAPPPSSTGYAQLSVMDFLNVEIKSMGIPFSCMKAVAAFNVSRRPFSLFLSPRHDAHAFFAPQWCTEIGILIKIDGYAFFLSLPDQHICVREHRRA